jgi:hypothetical protein
MYDCSHYESAGSAISDTNDYIVPVVDGSFSKFIAESSFRRQRERCLG